MKKIFVLGLLLVAFLGVDAQKDSTQELYKRFPTVPPFKILLTDSVHFYSKDDLPNKKAVMVMLFNPTCEHCQHETEELIKNIDQFKDISIVMSSTEPFDQIKTFYDKYELSRFPNISVGRDIHYMLPSFFHISSLPFLGFYNKKKELISVFEGTLPMDKILAEFAK